MLREVFYTDDDRDDQEMFIDAINEVSEDVKVTLLGNGNDLLHILKNPPPVPDMIFLDLNMPVKNGFEVLKEIMDMKQCQDIPTIIFTTSNNTGAIEQTKHLGARLFVTKPSSYISLKNILRYVLSINWETLCDSKKEFVYQSNQF